MLQNYQSMSVWAGIIAFAIICVFLLIGNIIRRKIPVLRKSLLPTAVIAGLLVLILKKFLFSKLIKEDILNDFNFFLSLITYHAIALGFIAMGLKVNEKIEIKTNKAHSYFNGMLIVSTYLLQGIIGIALTFILGYTLFPEFKTSVGLSSGILLPFAFGQGPGQANNFGLIYEDMGLSGAQSYGLAIASMGFIWACIGGVIYLNNLNKKGKIKKIDEENRTLTSIQDIETPDEIPVAESIDKFTIQISLVFLVYIITYLIMLGITKLSPYLGDFGDTLISLTWGFNFIFGMIVALLAKKVFVWLRKKNYMTRQYPNNFMLNRISGMVFDLMVVASIAAIDFEDLSNKWIPFIIITLFGGLATLLYIRYTTKRVYKDYPIEAFCGMFGMLTGTASTGIALLREVDPNFKTPAATDLVTGSTTAIIFGFPIMFIAGLSPRSLLNTLISFIVIVILFAMFYSILMSLNPKVKKTK